jgi:hypothetical protein
MTMNNREKEKNTRNEGGKWVRGYIEGIVGDVSNKIDLLMAANTKGSQ